MWNNCRSSKILMSSKQVCIDVVLKYNAMPDRWNWLQCMIVQNEKLKMQCIADHCAADSKIGVLCIIEVNFSPLQPALLLLILQSCKASPAQKNKPHNNRGGFDSAGVNAGFKESLWLTTQNNITNLSMCLYCHTHNQTVGKNISHFMASSPSLSLTADIISLISQIFLAPPISSL